MLFTIHILLAIFLFLIQNWIGEKAYSVGYVKFSLYDEKDEALATNFVIKVFGPTIFLIVCVASFQYLGLKPFNQNIINVIYIYLSLRIIAIVLFERTRIVNWFRIVTYYIMILWLASLIYSQFITKISDLLPDFSQLKNEIWLLILVFVYQVGNKVGEEKNISIYHNDNKDLPELKKRKKKYILQKHDDFQKLYGDKITEINNNPEFREIVLGIIIFENFNRPRFVRLIERLILLIFKKKRTIGIMQMTTKKIISDLESVEIGTTILSNYFVEIQNADSHYQRSGQIIKKHCPDINYIRQVLFILKAIIENKYPEEKDSTYSVLYGEIISEFNLYD